MNMKMNELRAKARCLLLAGVLCAGFAACSDDDDESAKTPGMITATGDAVSVSYIVKGAVLIPVNVENREVELSPDKFTYDNFSVTEETSMEERAGDSMKSPVVTAVEKGEGSDYVLVLDYDYTGCTSCRVSFTLGYQGTGTAIPVSITLEDVIREMKVSHLLSGMSGQLMWNTNGEPDPDHVFDIVSLKGTGAHADNISLRKIDHEYAVDLDDLFEFTPEETAQGYAAIPVRVVMKSGNGNLFLLNTTFTVCPSRIMEPVTIKADDVSYVWDVKAEAEALGLDKDDNGYIILKDRDVTFYLGSKTGSLNELKNYGFNLFPSTGGAWTYGQDEETGDVVITSYSPIIKLLALKNLPAGEYEFIAHVKRLHHDIDDKQYVDIRMPIVKQ